jgi:hypothetical protein
MRPSEIPVDQALASLPAVAEQRLLTLEWPRVSRTGEKAAVRLVFDPFVRESQPSQISPPGGEAYSVLAEARLELPGVPHTPLGEVSQALVPGRPVTFIWDLLPVVAGDEQGTVWLHLRFIPTGGGSELRQVLSAQRFEMRVIDFMGLSGPWARALGSAGAAVGAVLCLDGVVIWLWSRFQKKLQGEGP